MAKVLLVEDDTNLREIFAMRLQAEGYDTLTADDGEQALAIAMKEKPDLIVADVMMPHLSGFEMLETLRAAPGMAQTKVVMMTALGQAEDQARGQKLGVIKYLVKSQVTLEDFARIIREVLPPGSPSSQATNQQGDKPMQDDSQTPAPADDNAAAPADNAGGAPADNNGGDMGGGASTPPAEPQTGDGGGDMGGGEEKPEGEQPPAEAPPAA